MTPEEIKTLGHAFFDGKVLQYEEDNGDCCSWEDWVDPYCPSFRDGFNWRIKPDESKKVMEPLAASQIEQEEMNDWRNQAHQSQSAFDRLQDQLAKAEQRVAELIPGNGKELSERMKRLATNSVWRYSVDQNKPVDMSDPNIQELFAIIDHLCIGLDSPANGASS